MKPYTFNDIERMRTALRILRCRELPPEPLLEEVIRRAETMDQLIEQELLVLVAAGLRPHDVEEQLPTDWRASP